MNIQKEAFLESQTGGFASAKPQQHKKMPQETQKRTERGKTRMYKNRVISTFI